MSLLEIEELRTGYGALPVLQGISFSVEEGQTAVIFGLNGAGKTTTVNCLAGLLPVWKGTVRFDGKKVSGSTRRPWSSRASPCAPRAGACGPVCRS
jgi:branched-chain amino acid transport system ATP-binding protein